MYMTITNTNSLESLETYKTQLNDSLSTILEKYMAIIIEYLRFISKHIASLKNKPYAKFILLRGIETINHVFNYILLYTKDVEVAYIYTEKSIYLYVEFITQVSENQNAFLQLSSKDAVIYVYKKTIYTLRLDVVLAVCQKEKEIHGALNIYAQAFKEIISLYFTGEESITQIQNIYVKLMDYELNVQKMKDYFEETYNELIQK